MVSLSLAWTSREGAESPCPFKSQGASLALRNCRPRLTTHDDKWAELADMDTRHGLIDFAYLQNSGFNDRFQSTSVSCSSVSLLLLAAMLRFIAHGSYMVAGARSRPSMPWARIRGTRPRSSDASHLHHRAAVEFCCV